MQKKEIKKILRHRNKLVTINIKVKNNSIDFAIALIDTIIDNENKKNN
jgi:acid stress-induced BolA-like protein IbaG/YrbA